MKGAHCNCKYPGEISFNHMVQTKLMHPLLVFRNSLALERYYSSLSYGIFKRIPFIAVPSIRCRTPFNWNAVEPYELQVSIGSGNGLVSIGSKPLPKPKLHDDVIKWKHFPRYWPFVRGIHRSPVNSPHKGQWRGALMFTLICARITGWVNNCEAGDLRRNRDHYDVIVMD